MLERGEVANSWRHERWDSLRLLTPNWQSRLPGHRYDGPDPDGYMTMGEVVEFIERFAELSPRARPDRHERHRRCAAPTTATSVDDEPAAEIEHSLPDGGDRERRLQPADGAAVQRRRCRRRSSS